MPKCTLESHPNLNTDNESEWKNFAHAPINAAGIEGIRNLKR